MLFSLDVNMHNFGAKSRAMRKELRQGKREIQMEVHRMIHEKVRRFPCRFENCNFAKFGNMELGRGL